MEVRRHGIGHFTIEISHLEASQRTRRATQPLTRVLDEIRSLVTRAAADPFRFIHREIQHLIQITEVVEEHVNARFGTHIRALQALLYPAVSATAQTPAAHKI